MTHPTSLLVHPFGAEPCELSSVGGALYLGTVGTDTSGGSSHVADTSPTAGLPTTGAKPSASAASALAPNPSLPGGWRGECVVCPSEALGDCFWGVYSPCGHNVLQVDSTWKTYDKDQTANRSEFWDKDEPQRAKGEALARAALAIAEPWPGYVEPKPASNGTESKPELPDVAGGVPLPEYMRRKPSPEFLAKASALRTPARETLTFGKPGDPIICTFHLEGDRLVEWKIDHQDESTRRKSRDSRHSFGSGVLRSWYNPEASGFGELYLRGTHGDRDFTYEITDVVTRHLVLRWGAAIDDYNAKHRKPAAMPGEGEPVNPYKHDGKGEDSYDEWVAWNRGMEAYRAYHLSTATSLATVTAERDELRARCEKMEAALIDFRDHGVRADLQPTRMIGVGEGKTEDFYRRYLSSIDARVRERAATSIPTPTDAKGESK